MKRIIAIVTSITCAVWLVGAGAPTANALTAAELQTQIDALLAQLSGLQGQLGGLTGGTAACTFTRPLYSGVSGADVKCLQQYLNGAGYTVAASGAGSAGNETEFFGSLTAAGVKKWQDANGIVYGAYGGYFGPVSQAKYNALTAAAAPAAGEEEEEEEEAGELEGGAGSVDEYELSSGLQNEEVGEDEEDVDVAGLKMTVSEDSDLEFTAVTLDFDQGAVANDDQFEEYASEVSIWLDGEEVARVDADKFDEDTAWRRTVTLDDGAVAQAGEVGELIVAISGASSIDANEAGDTWTVDFDAVRFVDATGASTSEDPGTAARTFSLETFATAEDVELKVALNEDDEDINDAHLVDIDDADDTDNVEFLSFTIEIEGDSDVTLDDLPVEINTVENAADDADYNDPAEVINGASLWMDGEEVGTESLTETDGNDTEVVTFDDLDLTLEAGETYEFLVKLDLESTAAADELENGDTIEVEMDAGEVDAIDASDETGEDLAAADLTGTADADAHAVYDAGIFVEFVSASATRSSVADEALEIDTGEYKIRFDVTAFDADMQIDRTTTQQEDQGDAGEGLSFVFEISAANTTGWTVTDTLSRITGETAEDVTEAAGNGIFEIDEDDTDRFELTVSVTPDEDSFVALTLEAINWATSATADAASDQFYTFNLDEFKTDSISLNVF